MVQNIEIKYLGGGGGGVQKNAYFLGMMKLWIFLGSS